VLTRNGAPGCSDWLWVKGTNGIKWKPKTAGLVLAGQPVVIVGVSHYAHSVCGLDISHGLLLWQPHALPQSTHLGVVGGSRGKSQRNGGLYTPVI